MLWLSIALTLLGLLGVGFYLRRGWITTAPGLGCVVVAALGAGLLAFGPLAPPAGGPTLAVDAAPSTRPSPQASATASPTPTPTPEPTPASDAEPAQPTSAQRAAAKKRAEDRLWIIRQAVQGYLVRARRASARLRRCQSQGVPCKNYTREGLIQSQRSIDKLLAAARGASRECRSAVRQLTQTISGLRDNASGRQLLIHRTQVGRAHSQAIRVCERSDS